MLGVDRVKKKKKLDRCESRDEVCESGVSGTSEEEGEVIEVKSNCGGQGGAPGDGIEERMPRPSQGRLRVDGMVQAYLPLTKGIDATFSVHDDGDQSEVNGSGTAEGEGRRRLSMVSPRGYHPSREVQAESIRRCASMFLEKEMSMKTVTDLLDEAYMSTADDYGLDEAIEWGGGFTIPESAVEEGEAAMLRHGGDFSGVVTEMKQRLAHERLSLSTVGTLSKCNPEVDLMKDLVDGVRVFTRDDFVRNGCLPPLPPRNMYLRAEGAVHKLFYDLVEQGLAVVMRSPTARTIEGSHYIVAHWAPKKGKKQGRGITDASDESYPSSILNGDEVKDKVDAFYGIIEHPTIVDVASMVLRVLSDLQEEDPNATLNEVDMYKCDLKGAFNLLWWRTEDAPLFSVELSGGLTIVFLCGTFGYTGMPGAFQVVTRALKHEMRIRAPGRSEMYVDDLIGGAARGRVPAAIETAEGVSRGLLGPKAIAEDKTERTTADQRRLDVLGYTIDLSDGLDGARVTISKRNRLKAAYGFFSVDFDKPVPFGTMEKLASWSARYGFICVLLKPFTQALFGTMRGRRRNASITLGVPAKRAVLLWRAILCAIAVDEDTFARPLRSFAPRAVELVIRFDASLSGVGILVGIPSQEGIDQEPQWVGGIAVSLLELGFGEDSSNQNCAEFIGATLSLVVLRSLDLSGRPVRLEGDSISALTWAEKGTARGERAHSASMIFSLASVRWGLLVPFESFGFVTGKDNFLCDALSRGIAIADLGIKGLSDFGPLLSSTLLRALEFCNPDTETDSDSGFSDYWEALRVFLDNVLIQSPEDCVRRSGGSSAATDDLDLPQLIS